MTERYFGFPALVARARASAPACRSSTTTRRRSAPTASRTRSPRTTSTADRRSSSTSAPPTRSRRSASRASTSAARSSPASRSRWTRCSGGPRRLRRVELVAPQHVIGKSTVESIQSGCVYGFSGQVDALVERFQSRARASARCSRPAASPSRSSGTRPDDPALRAVAHPPGPADHLRAQPMSRHRMSGATSGARPAKLEDLRAAGTRPVPGAVRPHPHGRRAARALGPHRGGCRDRRRRARRRPDPPAAPPGQADVRDAARRHRGGPALRLRAASSATRATPEFDDLDLGDWVGVDRHRDEDAQGRALGEGDVRSSCSRRRSGRSPRSGTASPTSTPASASATSTSSPTTTPAACSRSGSRSSPRSRRIAHRARLRGGRDAGAPRAGGRCRGPAVRDAPQRARHAAHPADRARAPPEAAPRGRARAGLRDRAGVPQRGLSTRHNPEFTMLECYQALPITPT